MLKTCEFFPHENRYPRRVPLAWVFARQCSPAFRNDLPNSRRLKAAGFESHFG